jgi:Rhs element Vgr protein
MGVLDIFVPKVEENEIPAYKVKVGGAPLPDKYGVASITINHTINKIPYAQVVILDGSVADQKFEASDSPLFLPGKEMLITLGTKKNPKPIFQGIIVKHSIKMLEGKPSMLVVELKDKTVKLTIERKNKFFSNKTDGDIIRNILGAAYTGTVDATVTNHQEMVQYFSTDWDFVLTRAEANGMLAFVKDGKVSIKKPVVVGAPVLSVVYSNNVYEFEAEIDARDEYKSVEASSWDDAQRKVITQKGTATPPYDPGNPTNAELADVIGLSTFSLQHSGQITNTELRAWASSKLMRSHLAKFTGRVKIDGFKDIYPGDIIAIDKFSKRFNAKVFVSSVTHSLSAETAFYTDIQFGLSQEWFSRKYSDISELPASGLLPPVSGLQIGIVKKITGDPNNDFRVKVNLPMVKTGTDGVWARLALLDAGKERGTFFFPEVDDEVIVGFMNDDPRDAVILGSLYSKNSKGKPPLQPEQNNYKKGIFTKSKIKFQFDDEKKSVHIETPGGQKVFIEDKDNPQIVLQDKNKNKIEMTKDGITITSGKDLKITAKGDISIEGSKKVTVKAKQSFNVDATGTIEIKTNSKNTIKGTPVELNP